MCSGSTPEINQRRNHTFAFPGVDAYSLLKATTEVYIMTQCDVAFDPSTFETMAQDDDEAAIRLGRRRDAKDLTDAWGRYASAQAGNERILPYLDIIRRKLGLPVLASAPDGTGALGTNTCYGVMQEKLTRPFLLELIWSYWHEEGMLVQTMNAISTRFQNRRSGGDRDPLANLEIDVVRPLSPILWGWIQDEQHRLSVARRAYEYEHHYGFTLLGKAVPRTRPADSRSKFIEAFHNLLSQCIKFYNDDDDTTRIADGFAVLNGLKEVHLLLTEGGHNQYGQLPWVARLEMLMTEWILARPEMREFIGGRPMVAYTEPWMDRVDTMKSLQGWTDTNVTHFRDLGVFGEQLLLSIRFGAWNGIIQPMQAANWARYWRAEVQGYVHAYRAATSVDLTAARVDAQRADERYLAPAFHLRSRLADRARRRR